MNLNNNSIVLLKLSIQEDGEEYIIGDPQTENYIKVPSEAVEVIKLCNGTNTIEDIQKKNSEVDVLDFIETLMELELVFKVDDLQLLNESIQKSNSKAIHFTSHLFFNRLAYSAYGLLFLTSILLLSINPDIMPHMNDFFLLDYMGINFLIVFLTSWILTFIHEFGHFLAASKFNVPVKFQLSLRMYWLVVEANMTNLWSINKKQRYVAFFGGIMFDSVLLFTSLIVQLSSSNPFLLSYAKLITLILTFKFCWHFFVFLRTDLYYVLTNRLNISNLHENAKIYITQLFKKKERNFDAIPESEIKQTKLFASLYSVGFIIAIFMFFGYSLPILALTIETTIKQFAYINSNKLIFLDGLLTTLLLFVQGLIWLLGAINKIKESKKAALYH
jgi:putative peptide zinc metalloprotease protein